MIEWYWTQRWEILTIWTYFFWDFHDFAKCRDWKTQGLAFAGIRMQGLKTQGYENEGIGKCRDENAGIGIPGIKPQGWLPSVECFWLIFPDTLLGSVFCYYTCVSSSMSHHDVKSSKLAKWLRVDCSLLKNCEVDMTYWKQVNQKRCYWLIDVLKHNFFNFYRNKLWNYDS